MVTRSVLPTEVRRLPRKAPLGALDAIPWAYTTHRFVALGHDFAVRTMDPAFGRHLDNLFGGLSRRGHPKVLYSFVDRGPRAKRRYALYLGDDRIEVGYTAGYLLGYLCWHINAHVVETSRQFVLLHAAGAVLGSQGVVLPAESGSGKTTLVAGLVRAGFEYLTDEIVAIKRSTLRVTPYPKPLSIEPGSWPVLSDLEPQLGPDLVRYTENRWSVGPLSIRPGAVAGSAPVSVIVSPAYAPGSSTRLVPLRPAETLVLLTKNAFNLREHGRHGFEVLGAIARTSPGYRLELGDLDEACALVGELMGGHRERELA